MGIIYIITGQLDICPSDSSPRVDLERCVLDGDLLVWDWRVVAVAVSWWSIVILNHVSPGRCSQSGQLASVLRQSGKLFFVPLNAATPRRPKGGRRLCDFGDDDEYSLRPLTVYTYSTNPGCVIHLRIVHVK